MASPFLSKSLLLPKFRGSMIGALMGDCLGRPFEFDGFVSQGLLINFFSKLLNGESIQIFPYSDDTAMTVSVAKSLIANGELNPVDLAKKFVQEYFNESKRGYGNHVAYVFKALKDSEFKDVFLPAKLQFNGSGSYGNGSAMRISPMALFGSVKDIGYLKESVEKSSLITHTHPYGYNGAILQAFAIHDALKLNPQDKLDPLDFITELEKKMKDIETEDLTYCNSLQKMKDIYLKKQEDMSAEEIAEYLGNCVSAQKSVPTAIYSFLRGIQPIANFECSNPFVRSIFFAISLGGDTDTIASMTGSIAGAYYGDEIIPKELMDRCEYIKEVKVLAENLYESAHKQDT